MNADGFFIYPCKSVLVRVQFVGRGWTRMNADGFFIYPCKSVLVRVQFVGRG